MMDFDYTVATKKSFDEAVAAVEAGSKEKGFGVLHVHDVKATLAAKGFDREPLKIIEICNPKFASETLARDIRTALMLPCPITVYVKAGETFISALRPAVIKDFYPEAGLDELADAVDRIIRDIVDAAR
jgi:uncharacterized protein (DUF302 family)